MIRAVEGRMILKSFASQIQSQDNFFLRLNQRNFPITNKHLVFDFSTDSSFEIEIFYVRSQIRKPIIKQWQFILKRLDLELNTEIKMINKKIDSVKVFTFHFKFFEINYFIINY